LSVFAAISQGCGGDEEAAPVPTGGTAGTAGAANGGGGNGGGGDGNGGDGNGGDGNGGDGNGGEGPGDAAAGAPGDGGDGDGDGGLPDASLDDGSTGMDANDGNFDAGQNCPNIAPDNNDNCNAVPVDTPCDYGGGMECRCTDRQFGPNRWTCTNDPACPADDPSTVDAGATCAQFGLECNYGGTSCTCYGGGGWFCN
jgi:hypothetical protein